MKYTIPKKTNHNGVYFRAIKVSGSNVNKKTINAKKARIPQQTKTPPGIL